MSNWENFEIECTNYLNNKFGKYATFIHQGGSVSNVSDILVQTNTGNRFYIDVKHSPAQCGQFVLFANDKERTFEYSSKNNSRINKYAIKIMEHMNEHFDEFKNTGTKGKEIIMENGSQIFSDWIIQNYKEKDTKYFITNNYTILPIECFFEYFEVSAKYRVKKSGSGSVGKSLVHILKEDLLNNETYNYQITNIRIDGNKLFIETPIDLHKKKLRYYEYEYMFSKRNSEYELRKLSNTNNANVIFSIKQIEGKVGMEDLEFINILKK